MGFSSGSDGKESVCSAGDPDSIPGLGRSPGEGNGYLLQYSSLKNSMDRGAWWATVLRVAKGQIRYSWATKTFMSTFINIHTTFFILSFEIYSYDSAYLCINLNGWQNLTSVSHLYHSQTSWQLGCWLNLIWIMPVLNFFFLTMLCLLDFTYFIFA